MEQIGVTEFRRNAGKWLSRVEAGESFEVTERGRVVALLVPRPEDPNERMIAAGRIKPATLRYEDLGLPLPHIPGTPVLSGALEQLRADER